MNGRDTLKIGIYGDYEVGKTMQIKHLLKEYGRENILVINADGGLKTIKSHLEGVEIVRVTDINEVRVASHQIFATETHPLGKPIDHCYKDFNQPDKWLVFDGGSRIFEWIENQTMRDAENVYVAMVADPPGKIPAQLARYKTCTGSGGTFDNQKVYGFIGRSIEDFCSAWNKSQANIYINFMEQMTGRRNRERGLPWGPSIPGRMGFEAVMRWLDFIFRMYWDGNRCLTRTHVSEDTIARRRNDIDAGEDIPDVIENFNIATFARQMMSAKEVIQ